MPLTFENSESLKALGFSTRLPRDHYITVRCHCASRQWRSDQRWEASRPNEGWAGVVWRCTAHVRMTNIMANGDFLGCIQENLVLFKKIRDWSRKNGEEYQTKSLIKGNHRTMKLFWWWIIWADGRFGFDRDSLLVALTRPTTLSVLLGLFVMSSL